MSAMRSTKRLEGQADAYVYGCSLPAIPFWHRLIHQSRFVVVVPPCVLVSCATGLVVLHIVCVVYCIEDRKANEGTSIEMKGETVTG